MTLVITELSKFGVAMVADSAVTFDETVPSGARMRRILTGAQKLQVIPYLGAGVSAWGPGEVETTEDRFLTDNWLCDFIAQHSKIRSIDAFANALADELQRTLGDTEDPLGFHLAGYVDVAGRRLPTFYHVRNVEGTYNEYKLHQFEPGQDLPPRELGDEPFLTRNGDFGPYAVLAHAVEGMLPQVRQMGITIPYPSLDGRLAYLTA